MMSALAISATGCCCYTPMTGAQPDLPEDYDDPDNDNPYYTEPDVEEREYDMEDTGARPDVPFLDGVPYFEDEPESEPEDDMTEGR